MLLTRTFNAADLIAVRQTAALLDITEFRLFELAYRWWYGKPAPAGRIERVFVVYMFQDHIPFWLRHYLRHVQTLHEAGPVHRSTLGIAPNPVPSYARWRFGLSVLVLIVILTALFILAVNTSGLLDVTHNCYLPPCY